MKRVKVYSSISQFESFINNPEFSIIDVKVDSCEQSSSFQECFIGVVFYEDAHLDNNESVPSTSSNSAMSPCELFAANMVCRLGRTYPNNDRISCGNVACQLTQPQ